jgi:hypothetical protein
MMDLKETETVPLLLPVSLCAALMNVSLPTAHNMAKSGKLPLINLPGQRKVITARFEAMLGRTLTPADIQTAARAIDPALRRNREATARHRASKCESALQ